MGVWEDIAAIRVDSTIDGDEKVRRLTARLADEWQMIAAALPITRSFTVTIRGASRTVNVTLRTIGRRDNTIIIGGSDDRGLIDWPWQLENVPPFYPDPTGPILVEHLDVDGTVIATQRFRVDLIARLRDELYAVAVASARERFR